MAATDMKFQRTAQRSRCAALSREHELKRIRGMTLEERVIAALTMKQRFSWIHPVKIR